MEFLIENLALPIGFFESMHKQFAKYHFDKYSLERYVEYKNRSTIQCYETGYNKVLIDKKPLLEDVSQIHWGVTLVTDRYLKKEIQEGRNLFTNNNIQLKQSNIPKDSFYIKTDNRYYGIVCDMYSDIVFTNKYMESTISFTNDIKTVYITPDTKVRKERKQELEELKGRYLLEHTINPRNVISPTFGAYPSEYTIKNKWKQLLEESTKHQLALFRDISEYSIGTAEYKLLHFLKHEYLRANTEHQVEYFTYG